MTAANEIGAIGREIKAIDHLMQREIQKSASQMGVDKVTVMHGWIIGFLMSASGDVYQKDIESHFAISRSTVTNIVKCMEKQGYIKRESVDSDARLKKLVLTKQGREVGETMLSAVKETEKRFDNMLSEAESRRFLTLIRKLRLGLEQSAAKGEKE